MRQIAVGGVPQITENSRFFGNAHLAAEELHVVDTRHFAVE